MSFIFNSFLLSIKKIKRNILLNVFIVLQLALSIIITYMVYSMITEMSELPRVYKNFYNTGTYYIAPRMDYGNYIDIITEADEKSAVLYQDAVNNPQASAEELNTAFTNYYNSMYDMLSRDIPGLLGGIPHAEKIYANEYAPFISDGINSVYFIDEETAGLLSYTMKQGKWLTEAEDTEGYLPLVVNSTSTYNVNDRLILSYTGINGELEGTEAIIVGKVDETCFLTLHESVGGSFSFSEEDMLSSIITQSDDFTSSPFLCLINEDSAKLLDNAVRDYQQNYIIKLSGNLSEEQLKETTSYLQDNGIFYLSFDELYDNSLSEFYLLIRQKSVMICCAVVISLIGMIGFAILSLCKDKKIYDIYNFVGISRGQNIMINLFYALLLIAAALILFTAFIVFMGNMDYNYFIESDSLDYFKSIGIEINVSRFDFISIPIAFMLYAFSGSLLVFMLSIVISYLLMNKTHRYNKR